MRTAVWCLEVSVGEENLMVPSFNIHLDIVDFNRFEEGAERDPRGGRTL